jgi:SM-20-related protein
MTTPIFSGPLQSEVLFDRLIGDLSQHGYSIQPNALDPSFCSALLEEAQRLDLNAALRPGEIASKDAEHSSFRQDRILWLEPGLSALTDSFLEWGERLRMALNRELFMGLVEYEGHIACYAPACGYKRHLDRAKGTEARMLTLIAYLNPNWTAKNGGQLRLHLDDRSYIDVLPQAGTVTAFLSADFWHEVMFGTRDRWAITGWFRQRVR